MKIAPPKWRPGCAPGPRGCYRSECCTGGTRELFACTHPSTSSTRLDKPQVQFSNLWYDPAENRIQSNRFGGACSINCTKQSVILLFF